MSATNDVNFLDNPSSPVANLVATSNPDASPNLDATSNPVASPSLDASPSPIMNSLLNMSTFGMWGLWFCIGIVLLLITMAIESSQIIFTLYCCGAFIILLSFVTLF